MAEFPGREARINEQKVFPAWGGSAEDVEDFKVVPKLTPKV